MAKMLKKMTAKNVMGEKIKAPEKPTELFTIYGIAKDVKKGESTYGPWTMLRGSFEAIKGDERFVSTECALPQPLHDLIVDAVCAADGADVQFATKVILAPAENVIGYEYFAEPIVEQQENDPLSTLRAQVAEKLAIPAPSESEATKESEVTKESEATKESTKKK